MQKEEDLEEKYEETKTNFKGAYLRDGLAEIWNGMSPTPRNFPQKNLCSSIQGLLSYRCVKTAFTWLLYNTHLSVMRPYWLYLAHYHVSCYRKFVCLYCTYVYVQLLHKEIFSFQALYHVLPKFHHLQLMIIIMQHRLVSESYLLLCIVC